MNVSTAGEPVTGLNQKHFENIPGSWHLSTPLKVLVVAHAVVFLGQEYFPHGRSTPQQSANESSSARNLHVHCPRSMPWVCGKKMKAHNLLIVNGVQISALCWGASSTVHRGEYCLGLLPVSGEELVFHWPHEPHDSLCDGERSSSGFPPMQTIVLPLLVCVARMYNEPWSKRHLFHRS